MKTPDETRTPDDPPPDPVPPGRQGSDRVEEPPPKPEDVRTAEEGVGLADPRHLPSDPEIF